MNRQYIRFADLPVGAEFAYNGNTCRKVSTMTALFIEYGRRFYFRRRDLCVVGPYCAIEV